MQKNVELILEVQTQNGDRAKNHWLKAGDRKTKFVHMQATKRRKPNTIRSIKDQEGTDVTEQDQIGETFTKYFFALFTTSSPSNFDNCLFGLQTKVSQAMNDYLLNKFTEEEVK